MNDNLFSSNDLGKYCNQLVTTSQGHYAGHYSCKYQESSFLGLKWGLKFVKDTYSISPWSAYLWFLSGQRPTLWVNIVINPAIIFHHIFVQYKHTGHRLQIWGKKTFNWNQMTTFTSSEATSKSQYLLNTLLCLALLMNDLLQSLRKCYANGAIIIFISPIRKPEFLEHKCLVQCTQTHDK